MKQVKKPAKKKLTLKRETVRVLTSGDLTQVGGASGNGCMNTTNSGIRPLI